MKIIKWIQDKLYPEPVFRIPESYWHNREIRWEWHPDKNKQNAVDDINAMHTMTLYTMTLEQRKEIALEYRRQQILELIKFFLEHKINTSLNPLR